MLLEVLPQIKQEIVNRKRVDMQLTKRIEVPNKTVQAIRMASKFNDRLPYVCNELFEMTKNISDDKTGGDGTNIAEGFEFTPRIFDTYWVAKNRWENEEISWKYSWRYPADPFEGSDDYFYCCEQLAESSDVSDNIKIAQSFLSDGLFYLIRKVGRDSEFEEISLITSSPQIGAMFFDSMAGYCAAILEKNISGDLFAFVLTPNMVGNDVLWSAEVCSEEIAILMDFDDYESDSKTVVCIPEVSVDGLYKAMFGRGGPVDAYIGVIPTALLEFKYIDTVPGSTTYGSMKRVVSTKPLSKEWSYNESSKNLLEKLKGIEGYEHFRTWFEGMDNGVKVGGTSFIQRTVDIKSGLSDDSTGLDKMYFFRVPSITKNKLEWASISLFSLQSVRILKNLCNY